MTMDGMDKQSENQSASTIHFKELIFRAQAPDHCLKELYMACPNFRFLGPRIAGCTPTNVPRHGKSLQWVFNGIYGL